MNLFKSITFIALLGIFLFSCEKDNETNLASDEASLKTTTQSADTLLVPMVTIQKTLTADGTLDYYTVTAGAYVPSDSEVSISSVEEIDDSTIWREITLYYTAGNSDNYTFQSKTLTIQNEELGESEKGVYVTLEKVRSGKLCNPEKKGLGVAYEDVE